MRTEICDLLDIDLPLLAFSHCRDVVAAVTNAGGFGVLGASSHTPEALEAELAWIDSQVKGRPYGVDIICPETYEGKGQELTDADVVGLVPEEHKAYVLRLLADHDLDAEQFGESLFVMGGRFNDETGARLLEVTLKHPVGLLANALGVPPSFMLEAGRSYNVPVAALVGAKEHAIKQVQAGVDVIVAQGGEAGGHCGDVSTMVLVPEVIEAIKPHRSVPVLAAGGIVTGRQVAASVAMGAAGAWMGSVWLTTEEAETAPYTVEKMLAAGSRDTVRSKGRTGKYSRQLRSDWTDAWEAGLDAPAALPMPLQSVLSEPTLRRIDQLAAKGHPGAQRLATYFVGQGVGLMTRKRPAREVVLEMAEDYLAATERLAGTLG
ncbi:NAD(P)H-dependent flavin oxidoreductase [Nocardioides insulae]|uniref:NAD(P)H-dependent flavin oxidoreductase n=1 Tax=Nocardioides insulae TaxID=394734 RepID=UPI000403F4AC|nr:nitronate monooxygenase [Nocardioides insulae]